MKLKISAYAIASIYTLTLPLGLGVAAHWAAVSAAAATTELAAWVQAIGSLLAVGAAILAGQYQTASAREISAGEARREREREHRAALGLLSLAIRYGEESIQLMEHASSLAHDFASPEGFEAISAGLEVLPVHTLPTAEAALSVVTLRAAIARFHSRHRTLQRERREGGVTPSRQQQLLGRMAGDRQEAVSTIEALRDALGQVQID